jgi:hypothetical protein
VKTLEKCKVFGIATPFSKKQGELFRCSDTSPCNARREFGKAKCCSESPMLLKEKKKPDEKIATH